MYEQQQQYLDKKRWKMNREHKNLNKQVINQILQK
jgi:hypothetical protein